ncbi:MAG: alpha/beta hydrolase [Alphaproteobacteria bacterium]|nr:alpha/beta hydrolase [Alphaproteobacteria bacterium]
MTFSRSLLAFSMVTALLAGCSSHPVMQEDTVKRTASPVFMNARNIPGNLFIIEARERIYNKYQPATIYIEGDGVAYLTETRTSNDPTPDDPVALRLAAQDSTPNVIWLARPCQYNKGWRNGKTCPTEFWTTKRFSPEVIENYNIVLDNIRDTYGIPSFELVGYDGGAAIATILAAQRKDITSLRTVAGNLDPKTTSALHNVAYSEESLSPVDFAPGVVDIPQRHFLGKLDRTTPPAVYNSFAQNVADGHCLNATMVDNADHTLGWVEQWTVLKSMPIDCAAPPEPVQFDPTPLDGDKYQTRKK